MVGYSYLDKKCINHGENTDLFKECANILQLRGIEALRMSYLYDGTNTIVHKIPDKKIFVSNHYKNLNIPYISLQRLNQIVKYNNNI